MTQDTTATLPTGTEVASLVAALRHLYDTIGDCLDDNRIEDWPQFFTDDARYRLISRENHDAGLPIAAIFCDGKPMLLDRVLAHREAQVFEPRALRHFISGVCITAVLPDGRVEARANVMVTEAMSDEAPRVFLVGRYLDRLRHTAEGWRLEQRDVVYDNHSLYRAVVVPV